MPHPYDFEAWLLPYWPTIQRLAGHNRQGPPGNPETVNHNNPPAYRIKEIFEVGSCRDSYVKPRDALRILKNNNLTVAIDLCAELKALVNTIISISGEPLAKCSVLAKVKEGEDSNRRNTGRILRIRI